MSNSKNKKLFAGPYLGELGWELFCWQGYIRWLSESFDHTTICCRKGLSGLYKDFADKIIEYNPPTYSPSCERNTGDCGNYPKPDRTYSKYIGPNPSPSEVPIYQAALGDYAFRFPQKFFKYGNINSTIKTFDILIHARSRSSSGGVDTDNRNLAKESWENIVSYLKNKNYTIASIGSTKDSLHISNTTDLRGINIDELCDYCHKAKCMMSPSSGPLHLAALCGTEIIVWSGDSYNEHRYKKAWNPFNNKVHYINGWGNVDISKIKQSIDNLDER